MTEDSLAKHEKEIVNNVMSDGPPIMAVEVRYGDVRMLEEGGAEPMVHRLTRLLGGIQKPHTVLYVRPALATFEVWPTRKRQKKKGVFYPSTVAREKETEERQKRKEQGDESTPQERALELFKEEYRTPLTDAGFDVDKIPFPVNNVKSFNAFLKLMDVLMRSTTEDGHRVRIGVVFDDFHYLLQAASNPAFLGYLRDLFKLWHIDDTTYRGNAILLVVPSLDDLDEQDKEIRKLAEPITVPLPSAEQRSEASARILKLIGKQNILRAGVSITDFAPDAIGQWSAGLPTISDLMDVMWYSVFTHGTKFTPRRLQQDIVTKKKKAMLKQFGGLVQYHDPEDLIGLDKVIIDPIIQQEILALAAGFKSMVFAGPPGTGKTLTAQAIANSLGVPLLTLKGSLKNKFVGESPKNLNAVFEIGENINGCVLFFDEIDTMFPKRGEITSSDVGKEMLGQLFQKLSGVNEKGNTLFVGATNFPQALDPALTDRITTIPILPPDLKGAVRIMQVHLDKYGYTKFSESWITQLLKQRTETYLTGRIISSVVERAHYRAKARSNLSMKSALEQVISAKRFPQQAEVQSIIDATLEMVDMQDIIPERYRKKPDERKSAKISDPKRI